MELSAPGLVLPTCAAHKPVCEVETTLVDPVEVQPVRLPVSKSRLTWGLLPGGGVTLSETGVVCAAEGAVPVTVMEYEPVGVFDAVLTVMVELPPVETEVGLKLAVAPAGGAVAESVMVSALPRVSVVEMVEVPDWPCWRERLVGFAPMEKSLAGGGVAGQPGSLNEPMRVFQLNVPSVGMYSLVNQKVQSSVGSTPSIE